MELFIDPTLTFEPLEKRAAEVDLPEDPNKWPHEILQELYKQVPYISDFEPHVMMDKVDAERGYGFGHVRVSNQTQMQYGVTPEEEASAGVREARIPVIIREGRLLPFDLIVTEDSKMQPLTEARLRQAIFRPQMFDIASSTPGDQSLISQLYPPYRDSAHLGGGMVVTKEGSAKRASILEAILPTINSTDHQEFMKAASDPHVQAAFVRNAEAAFAPFNVLYRHTPLPLQKVADVMASSLSPSVVQVVRVEGGYKVKEATHAAWLPVEEIVGRKDIIERYGTKVAMEADMSGAVTMADGAESVAEQGDEDMGGMAPISDFGLYKVQTVEGDELVGYVIPHLLDVDGTPVPLALFTNGSQAAVQGSISGVPAAEGAELPTADKPAGYGSFFSDVGDEVVATVPMEVKGSFSDIEQGEPDTFAATTFAGREILVSLQPNIQAVVGTEDGKMLVPAHFKWLPLAKAGATALLSEEDEAEMKTSSVYDPSTIEIRSGGPNDFYVSGPYVDKLAYDQRNSLSIDDAMFLLAGLGVEQGFGATKLAESISASSPIAVKAGRPLGNAVELRKEAMARAKKKLASLPKVRSYLFKEAAVIPDPGAVDTVLSLGFINPENLMTFVSYLPTLETAQKRLCELLLAARVGMEDIPVSALERAVRSVEEAIEGLKTLCFQGPS